MLSGYNNNEITIILNKNDNDDRETLELFCDKDHTERDSLIHDVLKECYDVDIKEIAELILKKWDDTDPIDSVFTFEIVFIDHSLDWMDEEDDNCGLDAPYCWRSHKPCRKTEEDFEL